MAKIRKLSDKCLLVAEDKYTKFEKEHEEIIEEVEDLEMETEGEE